MVRFLLIDTGIDRSGATVATVHFIIVYIFVHSVLKNCDLRVGKGFVEYLLSEVTVITYHLFPITYHLPPTTYHLSPVTCHLSQRTDINYHVLVEPSYIEDFLESRFRSSA